MSDAYAAPHDVPERSADPEVRENARRVHREWPGLPRAGGGDIATLEPLEGPEHDLPYTSADLKARIDEAFDQGFRCGTEIHRCELRDRREARDALAARRSFYLQVALLLTIAVVVMCSTWLLVHG